MTMIVSDQPKKVVDEVIAEVRAIKRAISEDHGNDIDRLLASLICQERASGTIKAEQDGADQPATVPKSNSEGEQNAKPESEARSQ